MEKILAIDDDSINNFIVKRIINIKMPECEIITLQDARDGIAYLKSCLVPGSQEKLPDLILLDINMPIMNGWDFLDALQQLNNDGLNKMMIYMLSSSINKADREKANSYKIVSGYIAKPLTQEHLAKIANSLIEN